MQSDSFNLQYNPSLDAPSVSEWQAQPTAQAPPLPPRKNNAYGKNLRLRTHDWGMKSENGWSKFNRSVYYGEPQFERKRSVIPTAPSAAGLQRTRAWNQRRTNLRTRNWGTRSMNGWSGFNHSMYSQQSLAQWDHKSIILEELRAKSRGSFAQIIAPAPVVPVAALPSTIVPVNMLPPPINSGSKYQKLIGTRRGANRARKHLKQPLSNFAQPVVAPTAVLAAPSMLTPLGTSATSGFAGLPMNHANKTKLTRKQRKAAKRNNIFSAPNIIPANEPVIHAIPVTNVISSPILSSAAPAPIVAAPITNTFVKTEQYHTVAPLAMGRPAF